MTAAATTHPRTIDNGGGERLTFVRTVGDRLECESVAAPGSGPPMHVHHLQEEAMTVVAGRIGYQLAGGPEQFAEAGASVVFAPGEVHRWWNAGEGELRCVGHIAPAGNVEYFLTQLFASMRANGGRRPDPLDAAFLTRRYRSEFAMTEIPAPVQRLVFPVLVVIGRLLGRQAKYADAPEPLSG